MDDKNSTPDHTPDAPTEAFAPASAPAATPSENAPADHEQAQAQAATAEPAKPRRKRGLLIGGGIAAAVVLLGGGTAIGAAIADEMDDDDDRPSISDTRDGIRHDERDDRTDDRPTDDDDDNRRGSDDERSAATGSGGSSAMGTASADELIAIAEAAQGAADGEVTSIDAKRDGTWEVQLTTADGADTDVRVDADLATRVVETEPADGDDSVPTMFLDDETIRALVEAALAEADGVLTDLDLDSDDRSPYDVSVLTADNRSVEIDLDAQFAVVSTDLDD